MRARLLSKLMAVLLAHLVLASGAVQGLGFPRCGMAPGCSAPLAQGARRCCDQLAVPTVPAQIEKAAAPTVDAPTLIAGLGAAMGGELVIERIRQVLRLTPHEYGPQSLPTAHS